MFHDTILLRTFYYRFMEEKKTPEAFSVQFIHTAACLQFVHSLKVSLTLSFCLFFLWNI